MGGGGRNLQPLFEAWAPDVGPQVRGWVEGRPGLSLGTFCLEGLGRGRDSQGDGSVAGAGGAGREGAAATARVLGGVPGGPEEAQGLCGQGSWLWTLGRAA